jgi:hypothetical protein
MGKPSNRTQKTPKGHEIPVPKREEFYADLERVVKTPAPDRHRDEQKKGDPPPIR